MKLYRLFWGAIASVFFASCTSSENLARSPLKSSEANQAQKVVVLDKNFKIAVGQTLYVPVYSHIYHSDGKKTIDLAVTLSIRNTDLNKAIVITSVNYYDSYGKLVRKHLKQPIELAALTTTEFVVDRTDTSGGAGAKFIVEWVAQTEVSEPIIETIMIGTEFQQGISFISPGKVIKSRVK